MKRQFAKIALAASIVLAMAFTLSCSSDDSDPPDGTSSPSGGGSGPSSCVGGTIKIGNQCWQKNNSAVESSRGLSKCYGEGGRDDANGTHDTPIYLSDAEIQDNCKKYGRLYDWEAANSVCPSGFRLPTKEDWEALTAYIESHKGCTDCDAKHLKATSGWNEGGNGLDSYGFSALPGGYGGSDGEYYNGGGDGGVWWSASENDSDRSAYRRYMHYRGDYALWDYSAKYRLYSVRCLQGN